MPHPDPACQHVILSRGAARPTSFTQMENMVLNRPLLVALALGAMSFAASSFAAEPPKAVICVSVDQLRADYLTRFRDAFSPDGFRRILEQGQASPDCRYPYSYTVTAAGHASLMTGQMPSIHGIVGNNFFVRELGKGVYCVGDDETRTVDRTGITQFPGFSPKYLDAPTVGDYLEQQTGGRAITFSISWKERSSILMAGRRADQVFWFEDELGQFVTSTYYGQKLPQWLIDWNAAGKQNSYVGKTWEPLKDKDFYPRYCTPDDQAGEAKGHFPNTFPKAFVQELAPAYYSQLGISPFGDDMTFDAAKAGIKALGIGKDADPDLVTLSLSCFDKMGHTYGPDSWEMADALLRLDLALGDFLKFLDAEIGEGKYALILSADHGVATLPEVNQMRRIPGGRVPSKALMTDADTYLQGKLGALPEGKMYIARYEDPYVILDPAMSEDMKAKAVQLLLDWLPMQEGIANAFSRSQLSSTIAPVGTPLGAAQRTYHPGRSGDVFVTVARNYFMGSYPSGTTHSGPYDYDQGVPLLAIGNLGPGRMPAAASIVNRPELWTTPQHMATIAAEALGLPPVP